MDKVRIRREILENRRAEIEIDGIHLILNADTHIPSEDNLEGIDYIVQLVKKHQITSVADVGVGSGIYALKLAKLIPSLSIHASDIKQNILDAVTESMKLNNISNVTLYLNKDGIWLSEYPQTLDLELIIATPPFTTKKYFESEAYANKYGNLQPSHTVMTDNEDPTDSFIDIVSASKKFNTRFILFRVNEFIVDQIIQRAKEQFSSEYSYEKLRRKGEIKYLLVSKASK